MRAECGHAACAHPGLLLQHRVAGGPWETIDDQPQRFASYMGVDRLDAADHDG